MEQKFIEMAKTIFSSIDHYRESGRDDKFNIDSIAEYLQRQFLLQQTDCSTLCHVINECSLGHTQVAKVFKEHQAAIDYAIEMNGHAERLKLNIEYRLLTVPLA